MLLKTEWFKGMDGEAQVPGQVEAAGEVLEREGFALPGDGVDMAIAACLPNSADAETLVRHLGYIINELSKFRTNVIRGTE